MWQLTLIQLCLTIAASYGGDANHGGSGATFSCVGLVDGYYVDPKDNCSSKYFACVGEIAYPESCAASTLVYDGLTGNCVYPYTIPACLARFATQITTIPPTLPGATPADYSTFICPATGNFRDPENNCSNIYYICGPDRATGHRFKCPRDTYYAKDLNQCLFFNQVEECSGTARPITVSTSAAPAIYPYDCSNKRDGNYPIHDLDCPQYFIQCANGISFPSLCPGELRYNPKTDECMTPIQVPSCKRG